MSAVVLVGWLLTTVPIQVVSPTALPFRSLTPDEGFPTTAVHHVMQDRHGFIWLSTRHGVYRYDGERYHAFKQDPTDANSLSSNTVWVSREDHRGWIWMGTLGGGLTVYQPTRGRFHRLHADSSDAEALPHHTVTALHEDERGRMWVGTDGGGLSRAVVDSTGEALRFRFRTYSHDADDPQSLSDDQVLDIAQDERGHLWLATYGGGVSRFDPERETFARYTHRQDDASSLSDDYAMSVSLDEYGNLWVGTKYGGLNYLETRTGRVHRVPITAGESAVDFVWRTRVFDGSTLWVGTYGGGAFRVEYEGQSDGPPRFLDTAWYRHDTRDPFSLADDFVLSIFRDRTGVVWLGTDNNGLSLHLDQQYIHPAGGRLPDGEPAYRARATAYAVDRQARRWLGTTDGLYGRPEGADTYRSFDLPDASSFVHRIREEEDGHLWFCTNYGLYRYDPDTDRRIDVYSQLRERGVPVNDRFFDLVSVGEQTYWAGTDDGLVAFTMREHDVEEARRLDAVNRRLVSPRIRRLTVRGDTVWAGTTGGGMYVIDRTHERVRSLAAITGDSTFATIKVLDWAFEADGTGWVATHGAGIVRLRPDGEASWATRVFTKEDGLPSNIIKALARDAQGRLWASTDEGLSGQEMPGDTLFRHVHLPVPGFQQTGQLFEEERGTLLVTGSERGLLRFHPEHYLSSRTATPPVAITQIHGADRPNAAPVDDPYVSELTLSPDRRWISIDAAVLDFAWPSANRLRYRIEGLQPTWRRADARGQLSVGDLSPGRYTIEIEGAGLHGASQSPARLAVTVQPTVWQTWWFRGLIGLAACALLVGGYRYRVRQLRRVERTRRRIADDLHDDIGSKISSVVLLLDAVQQSDTDSAPLVARATDVAREVVDDLRDVVWIVEGEHDDLAALAARMRQMAAQLVPEARVQFAAPDPVPAVTLDMDDRRHLYLFYKEALHNAAQHAQAEQVDIRLRVQNGQLTLSLRDDGCGFDPEAVAPGRGMRTLRKRAEALGAMYRLVSQPGRGTWIVLTLDIA